MKALHSFVLPLFVCLSLSGCVTGRREIAPEVPAVSITPTKGAVALRSITDARLFEDKPADPSTPSVHGKVVNMPADQRATMVGRQRNTYGAAIGDIALANGQTVLSKTRDLVTAGFAKRGYSVSTDPKAANFVDIRINQFWAWSVPGFWAVDFDARIECAITAKGRTFDVSGYGKNSGQMASDTNWEQAYEDAFDDFLKNLDVQLAQNGF